MPQRWNSCFKINYNMLLSSLRKTGLVQLFTCQLFEPPFLNQEVEIRAAQDWSREFTHHIVVVLWDVEPLYWGLISHIGCEMQMILNIKGYPSCFFSLFRFERRFDGLRLSNIVSKTYQALMIFEKKLSSVMNLNTNKL